MFFSFMLRQQALTRAALQQAALATAYASQAPYQSIAPGYAIQPYPYPVPMPQPAPAPQAQAPAPEMAVLAGLVDADGKVAWPLGLQIARPALETKMLRERIEGLVRVAAKQATDGRPQRGLVDEAAQHLADLRKAFQESRADMPERTARDAEAFLTRLDTALQAMR
ncbi:MAG: hypothetical protein L0Y71_05820 [Gemmataceae bacterium]|nr:hypothetical protein [Gemmataceae bacterium]